MAWATSYSHWPQSSVITRAENVSSSTSRIDSRSSVTCCSATPRSTSAAWRPFSTSSGSAPSGAAAGVDSVSIRCFRHGRQSTRRRSAERCSRVAITGSTSTAHSTVPPAGDCIACCQPVRSVWNTSPTPFPRSSSSDIRSSACASPFAATTRGTAGGAAAMTSGEPIESASSCRSIDAMARPQGVYSAAASGVEPDEPGGALIDPTTSA